MTGRNVIVVLSAAITLLQACSWFEGRYLNFEGSGSRNFRCTSNAECGRDLEICHERVCVQCVLDRDCSDSKPLCNDNRCVECAASTDCLERERCNLATNECALSCTSSSDCAGQSTVQCRAGDGYCVECTVDGDCTDDKKPACSQESGRCEQCLGDLDCVDSDPRCNLETLQCVECLGDLDCSERCDTSRQQCVECLNDADCPEGGNCASNRRCELPCSRAEDCDAKHPFCERSTGLCRECLDDRNCPEDDKPVCSQEAKCTECRADEQCQDPEKPACVLARNRCAQCTRDAHCDPGHICDLVSTRCVESPSSP